MTTSTDTLLTRAKALCAAGRMAWYQLELPCAREQLGEALALYRRTGDGVGTLNALASLMMVLTWQGDDATCQELRREGMAIWNDAALDALLPALANFAWAVGFSSSPDAQDDTRLLNEISARHARATGDARSLGFALDNLGMCHYWAKEYAAARDLLEEALPLFESSGDTWAAPHALWGLGNVARRQNRLEDAQSLNDRSMEYQVRTDAWLGRPYTLESYAYLALAHRQFERAARVLGAVERLRQEQGTARQPLVVREFDSYRDELQARLSPQKLEGAWNEGRALSGAAATRYAMRAEETQ